MATSSRPFRTGARATFLALALLLAAAGYASAHAGLVRSDPAPNAVLPGSPTQVRLWFSEPLDSQFNAILVVDSGGTRRDTGVALREPSDRRQLFTGLQQLQPGVYTVRWRSVSTDGHVIGGSFRFGVGTATRLDVAASISEPAGVARNDLDIPLRWLTLVASALVAGGFWFRQLVISPATADLSPGPAGGPLFQAVERRVFALIRIAAVALLVLGMVTLFNQAAQVGGAGLQEAVEGQAVIRLIMNTRYGLVWLARMMVLVGVLGVIEQLAVTVPAKTTTGGSTGQSSQPRTSDVWWWVGGGMSLGLLFTGTLVSHAAGREPALLSLAADFAHQTGAAAWLGSLFCLAAALPILWAAPEGARTAAMHALLSRFGRLGVVAAVVVLSSGWLSAWQLVVAPSHLFDTPYGLTLLAKLALVAPLLGLAAYHHLALTPRIQRPGVTHRGRWGALKSSIWAESAVGAAILIAAAVLAGSPPVTAGAVTSPSTPPPKPETGVVLAQQADDLLVEIRLSPAIPGANTLQVRLIDETGALVRDATVRVETQPAGAAAAITPMTAGQDRYTASVDLPTPGEWSINVRIQRAGRGDASAAISVPVPSLTPANLVAMAGEAMNRLTAMKERQRLGGAGGRTSVTEYRYAGPNAAAARGSNGEETVTLGATRFSKSADGSWTREESPQEFAFRFPQFPYIEADDADVALLRMEVTGGVTSYVVSYRLPRIDANFTAWIGADDHLIRHLTMLAPGHFMDAEFYDFNVPNDIRPPR